ncbi:stage II sporulation protein R [Paenibacillus agri]|uniref:Stage II sporulation protein R n=1 Tax=Paenibacillus agri TaxID=2744309 RepID=A0A850EEP9_9BACL|nr:stage II sporulation protein R [Paenibacillus agri]NUU59753.1 stage II sporulation protein R [Paenibacillus agri]
MNSNQGHRGDSLRITFKYTAILICFFMVILMMWEGQKTDAAVAESSIPTESIRLRILANSDGTQDQLIKRQIRDAVVAQMNQWVSGLEDPQSLEQARALIRRHLPELNALVGQELEQRGIDYTYNVELGVVPFPTKMYGGKVYPAGDYEALRVTLGAGKGQNWWCVLFPPLCFIDAGSGDAAAPAAAKVKTVSAAGSEGKSVTKAQGEMAAQGDGVTTDQSAESGKTPEVKFFVWELLQNLWNWVSGLWS